MKKIIITGNVGRDPEVKTDTAGVEFVVFSVGISVGNKQTPKTDWVDISCKDKLAETIKTHVRKGSKLLIEGYPTASVYKNKNNEYVATLRVYAHSIEFLGGKIEEVEKDEIDISDDEIPF